MQLEDTAGDWHLEQSLDTITEEKVYARAFGCEASSAGLFEQSNFLKLAEFTSGGEEDLIKRVFLNTRNSARGVAVGGQPGT